jgi:hypothetical protein
VCCVFVFMSFMCKVCMGVTGKENVWVNKGISNSWDSCFISRTSARVCHSTGRDCEIARQTDRTQIRVCHLGNLNIRTINLSWILIPLSPPP